MTSERHAGGEGPRQDVITFEQIRERAYELWERNHRPEGLEIEVLHSDYQQEMIREWIQQHGTEINGLGRLVSRAQVSQLYRQARYAREPIAA